MSDVAIAADGLGKRYRISHQREPYGRLSESLAGALRAPLDRLNGKPRNTSEWFWALQDVSFQLSHGAVLGVIGRNGAGKSTLLRILSRITEPTTGVAHLTGRVGSLLEVGTGFHPELTGRENIYLSGAVLGMRRRDIVRRFDEIVEFAGTSTFLDTPVKRYSSGMQVRLGFAVAAHLEPDILLVDEVLAVGDAEFQQKCLGRMKETAAAGRTVVFVSHDIGAVANLTTRCLYLESGTIAELGPTTDVIRGYMSTSASTDRPIPTVSAFRRANASEAPAVVVAIRLGGSSKDGSLVLGDVIGIDVEVEVRQPISGVAATVVVKDDAGRPVAILYSPDQGFTLASGPGRLTFRVNVRDLPLAPGSYFVDVGVTQGPATSAYDNIVDFPLGHVLNSGQVVQWPERPWGTLHPTMVSWVVTS